MLCNVAFSGFPLVAVSIIFVLMIMLLRDGKFQKADDRSS